MRLSLDKFWFARTLDGLPICSDDPDFLPVESGKLYRHPEQRVLALLIICRKRILVNDEYVFTVATGLHEVGQQDVGFQSEEMLFSAVVLRPVC